MQMLGHNHNTDPGIQLLTPTHMMATQNDGKKIISWVPVLGFEYIPDESFHRHVTPSCAALVSSRKLGRSLLVRSGRVSTSIPSLNFHIVWSYKYTSLGSWVQKCFWIMHSMMRRRPSSHEHFLEFWCSTVCNIVVYHCLSTHTVHRLHKFQSDTNNWFSCWLH